MPPAIELTEINKRFGGVQALSNVSAAFKPGEVHAIVGENGAGKSTLMKIITGVHSPDSGSYRLFGRDVRFTGPREAISSGIATVYQELNLFSQLSITKNLFLGREPSTMGLLNRSQMRRAAARVMSEIGVSLDPDLPVGKLTMGEKQLIEISRALLQDSRILVLDEPNSALTESDSARLFQIVRDLRDREIAIIYVSHRLEEVFAISDRITVLRDGRLVETVDRENASIPQLIQRMIGRSPATPTVTTTYHPPGGAMLSVNNLQTRSGIGPVSFEAHGGEILGFAGLEGSGAGSIFNALFGMEAKVGGSILINGEESVQSSTRSVMARGLGMIPASRRDEGLMMAWSITRNLTLLVLNNLTRFWYLLNHRRANMIAGEYVHRLRIASNALDKEVQWLSGGNQQKTLFAKWLVNNPRILILNDPTRGVDVGAKEEIHGIIRNLAANGAAILIASSEIDETLSLSHRTLILHNGRIVREFQRGADKEAVFHAISGMDAPSADSVQSWE